MNLSSIITNADGSLNATKLTATAIGCTVIGFGINEVLFRTVRRESNVLGYIKESLPKGVTNEQAKHALETIQKSLKEAGETMSTEKVGETVGDKS